MMSEPTEGDMMDVCSNILDVRLEVSRAVSRASLTLEGNLRCQEVGQDCPTPMEVTEDPSALEVAVAENLAPKDGAGGYPAPEGVAGNDPAQVGSAGCNPAPEGVAGSDPALAGSVRCKPAPEGVQVSSPSHTSMDGEGVALEVSEPDARILIPASGAESTPDDALQIVPVDLPSPSYNATSHDLGFPSFFSNLQVT
jgi:hypothetical protein